MDDINNPMYFTSTNETKQYYSDDIPIDDILYTKEINNYCKIIKNYISSKKTSKNRNINEIGNFLLKTINNFTLFNLKTVNNKKDYSISEINTIIDKLTYYYKSFNLYANNYCGDKYMNNEYVIILIAVSYLLNYYKQMIEKFADSIVED